MAELPERMPATAGHGDMRASDADREHVIGTLKAAFVQGRLAKDELGLRVGQALTSRTYAELAIVTADLPAGLTTAQPSTPARAPRKRSVRLRPGPVRAAVTVIYAGMWPLAVVLASNSKSNPIDAVNLVGSATVFYVLIFILTVVWAQALRGQSADPGQHTTEAARRHLPRPESPVRGHRANGALMAGTGLASG